MSPRPTIFISSVSKELRGARQLVANTLTFLGYEPIWQDIFGTEGGDLRQMLRQQIDQSKGVVQLVGQCYGAEPMAPDEEFGRISYTQFEALYARKKGKKVWYLFMDETFPIDPHEPEPEELRQLQAAYRNSLKADTHLFHPLATREALEAGVLKLRDDLTQLRRGARRWAWGIAALLVLIAAMVFLLLRGQDKAQGSLEQIAQRFDSLSSDRGLIKNPKTPEEHYHNARVHELGGNFSAARKEYTEYLSSNLEALDPWLSYSAMLKSAEGKAGAVETLRYFGDKLTPPTVSYQTALAMLAEGDARLEKLQALAASHPDFGPLAWLISQEYSEARRGDQTLADQRGEKEWLERFRAAHAAGKFEKFFLDKKEAQKWIEAAEARWAKLLSTPERVLENPVTLTAQLSGSGWAVDLRAHGFQGEGALLPAGRQRRFPVHRLSAATQRPDRAADDQLLRAAAESRARRARGGSEIRGPQREDERPLHAEIFHRRRAARPRQDDAEHDVQLVAVVSRLRRQSAALFQRAALVSAGHQGDPLLGERRQAGQGLQVQAERQDV